MKEKYKNFARKIAGYLFMKHPILGVALVIIFVFLLGTVSAYFYLHSNPELSAQINNSSQETKNIYAVFLGEIYDKIQQNYWDKINDEQLSNLFKLGAEKLTGSPQILSSKDKKGIEAMAETIIKDMDVAKKKDFTTSLANIVLVNLNPFGRSALYTQKDEQSLKNNVQNVDPGADLYKTLGVEKNASQESITKAYEEKAATLEPKKEKSPEAAQELAAVDRAYEALKTPEQKAVYDQTGIEPTVVIKLLRPDILYMQIKRVSPQTFNEFQKAAAGADKGSVLNSIIIDLRGNIGGSIDLLQYFLGPFIGQNQYAYDFFHQGEYIPFKTQVGWLSSMVRYKKVVILTDNQTQSSAEVMAAAFKRYNVGIVVGTQTKGWGTVEKVFPIDQQIDPGEKYSIMLVHSLTLRDDNQPIEGKGVDPTISTTDPNWGKQLFEYFNYQPLVDAVRKVLKGN